MRGRAVLLPIAYASTVACSTLLGDFAVSRRAGDGGTAIGDGGDDGGSATSSTTIVHALTANLNVYVGQTALLDASQSTTTQGTLAFAWVVKSAPRGSQVATATLMSATSPTASFVPDVLGTYVVQVTVTALGVSDSQLANVVTWVPPVLFAQGVAVDAGGTAGPDYVIADYDGGNPRHVLCPRPLAPGAPDEMARFAAYAGRAYDYWEAPAGQTSKFAGFTIDYTGDAGYAAHLWAGTFASTCSSPPADLGAAHFGPGAPFGSEPHFSVDGGRFVVFDREWRIVTYAADGSGFPHIVAPYPVGYAQASSSLDSVGLDAGSGYVFEPPRVEWTATGRVAWAQPNANGWEVVTAADATNATPTTYMRCEGVVPRQIAMVGDGTVLASFRQMPQASENLYQLKPDAQQNCAYEHQYTNLSDGGGATATDFAVSPDGTQLAFLEVDPATQDASPWMQGTSQFPGGYVYVVPIAGGTPVLVSTDPALNGPRWIGGGTAIVFTRLDHVVQSTGTPATSVVVVAADGSAAHVVAQGDGVGTFVSTSGSAGCRIATGAARDDGRGAALLPVAFLGWLARRRLRRSTRVGATSRPGPRGAFHPLGLPSPASALWPIE